MGARPVIRVLLIDDDEYHARLFDEYLKESQAASFLMDWVDTVEQGLAALCGHRHDVVLLDYYIGRATGFDLLDACPMVTNQVPVILLTAHPDQSMDTEALGRGAFDFLDKNHISAAELERTLRYAVQHFHTQQALRESKERFEGLYNAVFEGILVHDGERVLHANPALLKMMGRPSAEVIGAPLSEVFNGALVPVLAATPHGGASSMELDLRTRNEEVLVTAVRARRHIFNGRVAYLLAIRDITESKRHEAELKKMNEALELRVAERTEALRRSNQDLEHFAHVIAHDIRLPLHTVHEHLMDACLNLSEEPDPEESAFRLHFIEKAVTTVERLQGLIDSVLEYSRISSRETSWCPTNLNGVLRDALLGLGAGLGEDMSHVAAAQLPVVLGDPVLLGNLFQNLLQNAVKYRGALPLRLEIGVWDDGPAWRLFVRDNGIGFRPEEAHDIFVVLHRGGNAASYPGAGLGLATCKKIVELHGGRIWAEAEPGRGATFFFTLPKWNEEPLPEPAIREEGHEAHPGN
ncbi:MAG: response regulator [Candidatus Hydrogenedentes bacterium]|nr:response regulator [Candidatus Hydrogenedentota bacterium]